MNEALLLSSEASSRRGRRLLQWAVGLYVVSVVLPVWVFAIVNGGWIGGVAFPFGGYLGGLLLTREHRDIHLRRALAGLPFFLLFSSAAGLGVFIAIVAAWFGIFITAPWRALCGANGPRTIAGIISLVCALFTFPGIFAFSAMEWRPAVMALSQFLIFCFLVNVFLLNPHVQGWVTRERSVRGRSPDHWTLDW